MIYNPISVRLNACAHSFTVVAFSAHLTLPLHLKSWFHANDDYYRAPVTGNGWRVVKGKDQEAA